MSYKFEVINHPAQRVLSIRTRAAMKDLPVVLPKSFDAVAQYICDLGQQPAGAPVVGYYSSDPEMQNMEIEIGYPVAQTLPGVSSFRGAKGGLRSGVTKLTGEGQAMRA